MYIIKKTDWGYMGIKDGVQMLACVGRFPMDDSPASEKLDVSQKRMLRKHGMYIRKQ